MTYISGNSTLFTICSTSKSDKQKSSDNCFYSVMNKSIYFLFFHSSCHYSFTTYLVNSSSKLHNKESSIFWNNSISSSDKPWFDFNELEGIYNVTWSFLTFTSCVVTFNGIQHHQSYYSVGCLTGTGRGASAGGGPRRRRRTPINEMKAIKPLATTPCCSVNAKWGESWQD